MVEIFGIHIQQQEKCLSIDCLSAKPVACGFDLGSVEFTTFKKRILRT
jgi:hypothetical protein